MADTNPNIELGEQHQSRESKHCHGCNQTKPRSEFHKTAGRYCRECAKLRAQQYRQAHLEELRAYGRTMRERNGERYRTNARQRYRQRGGRSDEQRAYQREWSKAHRDRQAEYNLRRVFGIGLSDYEQMLSGQGGGCAVCGAKPDGRRLHVDHDHATGKIRGLLCHVCNTRLEWVEAHVEAIMSYLTDNMVDPMGMIDAYGGHKPEYRAWRAASVS